ncbi:MAG TPA: O-antigen ligase family protein, partial [Candidatus Dormibacteraeota bacterium]|nr:O-antigen ligase family protein [Candidatus Dormibacteraeota bacterium]
VVGALAPQVRRHRRAAAAVAVTAAVVVSLALVVGPRSGVPAARAVTSRVTSLATPEGGTGGTRIHIWRDTLALVASRPITGYGPDSFGLEFPRFATGDWTPDSVLDKAHSDVLQVAATQGVVGAAAYLWLLGATTLMLWRQRRRPECAALLGAFVAYELTVQLNFSYLPSAAPFWIFLAAAAVAASPDRRYRRELPAVPRRAVAAGACTALAAIGYPAVVQPFRADATYLAALGAAIDRPQDASADTAVARDEAPWEAAYAAEAGNLAEGLDAADQPAPDARWAAARDAYTMADRLGCADPAVFRHLALADLRLGLEGEALAAARRAVALDRFDGGNTALLRRLGG